MLIKFNILSLAGGDTSQGNRLIKFNIWGLFVQRHFTTSLFYTIFTKRKLQWMLP
jgi:hypothetical protein